MCYGFEFRISKVDATGMTDGPINIHVSIPPVYLLVLMNLIFAC